MKKPYILYISVDVRGFLADSTKLKDFITCRNCKQEFDHDAHKPFLLPCLDAICKNCTQDISTLEKQGLECDECHGIHICFQNGDLSLQVDSTREIAAEILRLMKGDSSLICEMCTNHKTASHRCFDCSLFICVECVKLHSAIKPFKSHTVSEIKGLLSEEKNCMSLFRKTVHCQVNGHENETLKMYCLDSACMKPVCVLCCITTHKEHKYCNIAEVGKENKTKIEYILKNVATKVDQAQKTVTELQDINDKCLLDSQRLQNEIKARFSEAKKALELREKTLCEVVASQVNVKQKCIKKEKEKLTSFINSCKQACYYGNISPKLNDHQSFLAIGNSIQLQLENLERQVIEKQVSTDIMTFSPKPSDACFTTSINSFGKILVTKVNPTKSKVVVTSSVCDQGEELQFQIQLYSSTGIPIIDENVGVHLKNRGKILKSVHCSIGTSSSTFTGKWVPDEPLKLSWIVVSNGIELETLEGMIEVKATETQQGIMLLWFRV